METSDIFGTVAVKSEAQSSDCDGLDSSKLRNEPDFKREEMDPEIVCRLCAKLNSSRNMDSGNHEWIKISDKWFHTTETIDFTMKKYFPAGVITAKLSNFAQLQHICATCFISLQQLKDFVDLIKQGQEKILKLLQQQKSSNSNAIPRRRGRPRKDTNNANSAAKETEIINVEQREKRAIRPPKRYGTELNKPEKSSEISEDRVENNEEPNINGSFDQESTLNFQLLQSEIVPFPGVFAEVIIEDTLDRKSFLLMPDQGSNEILSAETTDIPTQVVDKVDTDSINDEIDNAKDDTNNEDDDSDVVDGNGKNSLDDKSDATFSLNTFRRKVSTKKRKRGRPKKRLKREYKCDFCEKVFPAYASLVYHQVSNHQENVQDLCCTLCNKQFAHKALLTNHMFTHSSSKSFLCKYDDCKSSFKSRGSLYNHEKNVHESDEKKRFTCEVCGARFTYKTALQVHLRLHTGEKPYICRFCDKRFSHLGNMSEHVRTHTKEKPYVCDISECEKRFTTFSQLRCHKIRHLGSKSFICAECGKSFSRQTSLSFHLKSHKGKSRKCSMCHKEFNDLSALIKHQRIHSGEKPYKCGICNKSFSDPSNFRKHKQTHPNTKNGTADNNFLTPVRMPTLTHQATNVISEEAPIVPGSSANETKTSVTSNYQETNAAGPVAEPYIQIMTPEELTALSIDTSSNNGNILILYQPDELFSAPVNETQSLDVPVQIGETVVLEDVEEDA